MLELGGQKVLNPWITTGNLTHDDLHEKDCVLFTTFYSAPSTELSTYQTTPKILTK